VAPRGSSRLRLANALAAAVDGSVTPCWHEDSEPVPLPAIGGRFLNLTKGFDVRLPSGELLCRLVDDITINADLDPDAAALPGWHRLLTDDPRLLRLLARNSDPDAPVESALDRLAQLWDEGPERLGNVWRLEAGGATVALAAPLGGERERPCEIITPPLRDSHQEKLRQLLDVAAGLGFGVPIEAATHIHVDATPFRTATGFANLVRLFGGWRSPLRELLGTNPHCTRLQALPARLVALTRGNPTLDQLRETARETGLSKFFDVNLTSLLVDAPRRDTVEIRILPGTIDPAHVMARAVVVERLLDRCEADEPFPDPPAGDARAVEALRRLAA
jgi:hypothetical protein